MNELQALPDRAREPLHAFAAEVMALRQRGELTGYAAQRLLLEIDRLCTEPPAGMVPRALPLAVVG